MFSRSVVPSLTRRGTLGNGDEVRSISGIFLGVGTTSMTLSSVELEFELSEASSTLAMINLNVLESRLASAWGVVRRTRRTSCSNFEQGCQLQKI